jgi:hypothetical protein
MFCHQYFGKEEQNFISANEIDNMTLIMPTSASRKATVVTDQTPAGASGKVVSLPAVDRKVNYIVKPVLCFLFLLLNV